MDKDGSELTQHQDEEPTLRLEQLREVRHTFTLEPDSTL